MQFVPDWLCICDVTFLSVGRYGEARHDDRVANLPAVSPGKVCALNAADSKPLLISLNRCSIGTRCRNVACPERNAEVLSSSMSHTLSVLVSNASGNIQEEGRYNTVLPASGLLFWQVVKGEVIPVNMRSMSVWLLCFFLVIPQNKGRVLCIPSRAFSTVPPPDLTLDPLALSPPSPLPPMRPPSSVTG